MEDTVMMPIADEFTDLNENEDGANTHSTNIRLSPLKRSQRNHSSLTHKARSTLDLDEPDVNLASSFIIENKEEAKDLQVLSGGRSGMILEKSDHNKMHFNEDEYEPDEDDQFNNVVIPA
jgi:hypothetical protein